MLARWLTEVSLAVLAVAGAAVVAAVTGRGVLDLAFAAILLWCVLTVLRSAITAARGAVAERRTARGLAAAVIDDVARRAVNEERVRLAADIEAVVRASVTTMGGHARAAEAHWDDDPVPDLRGVQEEGRHAATELRRMLGLLREVAAQAGTPPEPPSTRARRIGRLDIALAVGAAVLSVVERYPAGPEIPPSMLSAASILLTALAASTIVLRRPAPVAGAAACGLIVLAGAVSGHPVSPGTWILLTPAWLAWAAMARHPGWGLAGTGVLVGGLAADLGRYNPVNLPICLVIVGVGATGGLLVGWSRRRQATAHENVVRRSAELDTASGEAVQSERLAVARDLHDLVSHAVAVMVMQAGAAEALRLRDRDRARTALAVVRQTAVETLAELDRVVQAISGGTMGAPLPTPGAVDHDARDLASLVDRMRGAGLQIGLLIDGPVQGATGAVVYRIAQEALTNAARHAPGARVTITVHTEAVGTTVEVVDDGPGADGRSRRGYGLVGIAERVDRLGGHLTTGSPPDGTGFRVSARLPAAGLAS